MTHRCSAATVLAMVMLLVSAALLAEAPPAPAPPPGEAADEPAETTDGPEALTVFEYLKKGGPVMIPIGLCSFLMLAFAFERAVSLRRGKVLPPAFVQNVRGLVTARPLDSEKILTYCQASPSPISRIFQTAIKRLKRPLPEIEKAIEDAGAREVRLLRRNCRVLSGVASVAPLLGLLGTVLGMIGAFQEIGGGKTLGHGTGSALAENIYEALVTTAAGLTVAIPSLVLYLVFASRIEKLVAEMDHLTMEFVEGLLDEQEQPAA